MSKTNEPNYSNTTPTGVPVDLGTNYPNYPNYPFDDKQPKQMGWVCPVCGRALAPWMSICDHGIPAKIEVTCNAK